MNTETLTLEEFLERFKPQKNHFDDNANCDGCAYETYGDELAYVKEVYEKHPNRIWTIFDCDGQMVVGNRFHFVNRMGYLICEVPFEDGEDFEVPDEDWNPIYEHYEDHLCPNCGEEIPMDCDKEKHNCRWPEKPLYFPRFSVRTMESAFVYYESPRSILLQALL